MCIRPLDIGSLSIRPWGQMTFRYKILVRLGSSYRHMTIYIRFQSTIYVEGCQCWSGLLKLVPAVGHCYVPHWQACFGYFERKEQVHIFVEKQVAEPIENRTGLSICNPLKLRDAKKKAKETFELSEIVSEKVIYH